MVAVEQIRMWAWHLTFLRMCVCARVWLCQTTLYHGIMSVVCDTTEWKCGLTLPWYLAIWGGKDVILGYLTLCTTSRYSRSTWISLCWATHPPTHHFELLYSFLLLLWGLYSSSLSSSSSELSETTLIRRRLSGTWNEGTINSHISFWACYRLSLTKSWLVNGSEILQVRFQLGKLCIVLYYLLVHSPISA